MKWLNIFSIVLLSLVASSFSANILYLNSMVSPSHFIWNRAFIYGLAARGHNVTALSVDIEKQAPENVHFIHLEGVYSALLNDSKNEIVDFIEMGRISAFAVIDVFEIYTTSSCKFALQSKGFQTLKNYPDDFKFDLVINDFLAGPCLLLFMHKFKYPPLIQATAFNSPAFTTDVAGSLIYPGITPHYELDAGEDMSLFGRVQNFIVSYYEIYMKYQQIPKHNKMLRAVYPDLPCVTELNTMAKLVLLNSHPAIQFKEPMMPNVISVAGLQIVKAKELPEDLKAVVENAKNGVILFSLGTNMRSDTLGDVRLTRILLAMKELPQYQFLWKFESDKLPVEVPKNVFIRAWMPQNDILGHPNVKLFITHCGLLSTQESVWHGVPVVGFPTFGDQFRNMNYMESVKVGKRVAILDFETKDLVNTIKEVLGNPSYAENMKKLSANFRDQPETSLERAVWWTEWVLRNPESDFIKSPAINLSVMKKYAFDVILVILGTILLLALLGTLLLWKVVKMFTKKTVSKRKSE